MYCAIAGVTRLSSTGGSGSGKPIDFVCAMGAEVSRWHGHCYRATQTLGAQSTIHYHPTNLNPAHTQCNRIICWFPSFRLRAPRFDGPKPAEAREASVGWCAGTNGGGGG